MNKELSKRQHRIMGAIIHDEVRSINPLIETGGVDGYTDKDFMTMIEHGFIKGSIVPSMNKTVNTWFVNTHEG